MRTPIFCPDHERPGPTPSAGSSVCKLAVHGELCTHGLPEVLMQLPEVLSKPTYGQSREGVVLGRSESHQGPRAASRT